MFDGWHRLKALWISVWTNPRICIPLCRASSRRPCPSARTRRPCGPWCRTAWWCLAGPGSISVAHTLDEHLTLTDLEAGVDLNRRLALHFLGD